MRRQLASASARMLLDGCESVDTPHQGFMRLLGPRQGEHPEWAPRNVASAGVKRWLGVLGLVHDPDVGSAQVR